MSEALDLPPPLVSVTPTGIFVEWHDCGLDVEIRLREGGVYVVINDCRQGVPEYRGNDSSAVGRALSALGVMEARYE